jgi:hypothetical protein
MRVLALLGPLEQFEELLMVVYGALGERFAADPDSGPFFARLSFDEQTHLAKLRYLGRLARENPQEFGEVDADLDSVRADLGALEEFLDSVLTVPLHDALVFMLRAEYGAAESHTRLVRTCANPRVAEVLDDLHLADTEHIARIKAHAEKLQLVAGF